MSILDLYQIKKLVAQRATRHPSNAAEEYLNAILVLLDDPTIPNAELFEASELFYLLIQEGRKQIPYGPKVTEAIRTGNFKITGHHYKVPGSRNYDPPYGYVYFGTSTQRPAQIKIGSTTNDPFARCRMWKQLHNYDNYECAAYVRLDRPAQIEGLLQKHFADCKAKSHGDSKEWYYCDLHEVITILEDYVDSKGYTIYERSWD